MKVIKERVKDLGGFPVGRFLPDRIKRQVGPFTFVDHMGPIELGNGRYIDVDQHPHIGLSTLSYLLEGEMEHRDSLGNVEVIKPGDVAFMTAGKGVTHTERTPSHLRTSNKYQMHGYQIWVALPKHLENMEPQFEYHHINDIPSWKENNCFMTLVAGDAFGKTSPLKGHSPLFMLDVQTETSSTLNLKEKVNGEGAIIIVEGSIRVGDEIFKKDQMPIFEDIEECTLELSEDTRILLFGGQPLEHEVYLLWNFASSDKSKLEKARQDWSAKRFPQVPGDNTYVKFV